MLSLTNTIVNSAKMEFTGFSNKKEGLTFTEKRALILNNLKIASELFKDSKDISKHKIVFERKNGAKEFPF